MPKGNPNAYRKIDEFLASLLPDELTYTYGAVEKMSEAGGETDVAEDTDMESEMSESEDSGGGEMYDLKKMRKDMEGDM